MFRINGLPQAFDTIEVQVPARARVAGWRPYYTRRAIDRLLEALGSTSNPYPFTPLQGNVNGMKGRVAASSAAIADDKINRALRAAEGGDNPRFGALFGYLRQVSTTYDICPMFVY